MFSKPTLYFGKDFVRLLVSHSESYDYQVSASSMASIITAVKEKSVTEANIVLSSHYTYTVGLKVSKEQLSREIIKELLQAQVPEVIEDSFFDWSLQASDDDDHYVQASVVRPTFFNELSKALADNDVKARYIKPIEALVSEAVDAQFSDVSAAVVCIADPEPMYMLFSDHAIWLSGLILDAFPVFSEFIAFAQDENISQPEQILSDATVVSLPSYITLVSAVPELVSKDELTVNLYSLANVTVSPRKKDSSVLSFTAGDTTSNGNGSTKYITFFIMGVVILLALTVFFTITFM